MARGASRFTFHISRLTRYLLLVTLLTACTVVRLTRPVVKIGLVGPFEGPYRYVGYDAIYAARLALQAANAAGGVARRAGYSVELVAYDDQGTLDGARVAARNLVQDPQVIAVIGHFRDETTEAAHELYDQVGLPLVVAGTVEGGRAGETLLLCPLLDYLGDALAVQRVAWLGAVERALPCADGPAVTISSEIPPPPGVDAVLLTLEPAAAGEALVALRAAGWQGPIVGGPTLGSPLFTRIAGEAAAGVLFVAPYRWPEPEGQDAAFSAAYRALGPHVPPPGPFALTAYQATQALLAAIETAGRQGDNPTRQALAMHLTQPPTTTVYLYRWTPAGTLELVKQVTRNE
jgi:ABC-type branched-subunit amino acid transport system substrate-binding protein